MSDQDKNLPMKIENTSPFRIQLQMTRVFINKGKLEIIENGNRTEIYYGDKNIAMVKLNTITNILIASNFWFRKATLPADHFLQITFEWQGDMKKIMKIWGINDAT